MKPVNHTSHRSNTGSRWMRNAAMLGCAAALSVWAPASYCQNNNATPAPKAVGKLVIPDYPTVKDQYEFASKYRQAQLVASNQAQKKVQCARFIQCYEKVLANYPDDLTFTPRAILDIGDCHAIMESWATALKQYTLAQERYPDNEYVQCRALVATGQIQDLQKRYTDAKASYKLAMERYGASRDPDVRTLVKKAQQYYYIPREEKAQSKGGFAMKSLFTWIPGTSKK